MKLVLQAINALLRKHENSITAQSNRIGAAQAAAESAQAAAESAQAAAESAQAAAESAQAAADTNAGRIPLMVRIYTMNGYDYSTFKPKEIRAAMDAGRMVMIYSDYSVFLPVQFEGDRLYIGQAYNTVTASIRSGKIEHNGRVYLSDE